MNAKAELLEHIGDNKVVCATVCNWDTCVDTADDFQHNLKIGYSQKDWDEFLAKLDFDYNESRYPDGFNGTIWYEDGSWAEHEREDYIGECWSWNKYRGPKVPKELLEPEPEFEKYSVDVTRIGYGNIRIAVHARGASEAMRFAEDMAGNYDFTEHTAEYQAQGATLIKEPTEEK
jgi:hypothetical protein